MHEIMMFAIAFLKHGLEKMDLQSCKKFGRGQHMHQLREIRKLGFPVRFASTGSGKPWSLRKELEVFEMGALQGE